MFKDKFIRALNKLKFLSPPSKGCNRKLLLQLYKSLIHSHLDYGAPVYGLANKSVSSLSLSWILFKLPLLGWLSALSV